MEEEKIQACNFLILNMYKFVGGWFDSILYSLVCRRYDNSTHIYLLAYLNI